MNITYTGFPAFLLAQQNAPAAAPKSRVYQLPDGQVELSRQALDILSQAEMQLLLAQATGNAREARDEGLQLHEQYGEGVHHLENGSKIQIRETKSGHINVRRISAKGKRSQVKFDSMSGRLGYYEEGSFLVRFGKTREFKSRDRSLDLQIEQYLRNNPNLLSR